MSDVSNVLRMRVSASCATALLIALLAIAAPRTLHAESYSDYASNGCYYTSCWWDQYGRHICHWVCPRQTPDYYYEPEAGSSNSDPAVFIFIFIFIVVVAIVVVFLIALFAENGATNEVRRAADEALSDAEEAAMAQAKLDQAIREVDDVISRQARRAFARGRDGSGDQT